MSGWRSILVGGLLAVGLVAIDTSPSSLADGGGGGGGDATDSRGSGAPSKPVDPNYVAAVKEIKAQKFSALIPLLDAVVAKDEKNADAYNWLAYAIRKTGDPARSIPIYHKALALDAKHRGAHEYIGEAWRWTTWRRPRSTGAPRHAGQAVPPVVRAVPGSEEGSRGVREERR